MENKLPNRKDLRMKDYDYSQAGYYFVTLCTEDKGHVLCDIIDGFTKLNNSGEMIKKWIIKLNDKYENVQLDEFVIMPNHIHFIVVIVGADPCVSPLGISDNAGTHMGVPLHTIIQWFKTMSTNEYIKGVKDGQYKPFYKRLWQRNYYEHVIRKDSELHEIREYIVNNPVKWELDKYFNNK
jgi:REP element-mobilizing transposase RayT